MKVNKIYYISGKVAEAIVEHLKQQNGFRKMKFIPLSREDIVKTTGSKRGFPIEEEQALLIWGNGYEHTTSYLFSPTIPYYKSVDDTHGDFMPFSEKLGCVTHNYVLLRNDPNVIAVEVLGYAETLKGFQIPKFLTKSTVQPLYKGGSKKAFVSKPTLKSSFSGVILHKSVDLDVIDGYPCLKMHRRDDLKGISLEDIRKNLEGQLKLNSVVRFDIGGLAEEALERPFACREGIKAYRVLIETCLSYN